jgi:hypothetical protein
MAQDVLDTLVNDRNSDLVILPRIMFDHPENISLDDVSPQEIAIALNRPVVLADQMGDVWDAVLGKPAMLYYTKNNGSVS